MKLKLAVAFAVFLFATLARADSSLIRDVTATSCGPCSGSPVTSPISLQAQFTVEAVTGEFFNAGQAYLFTGTEYEVMGITGTLNGSPMALAAAPQGIGSWLYEQGGDFGLGTVYFTADGSFSWLENDGEFNLLEILDANGDGYGTSNPINWTATDPPPAGTPEPSSLLLSGIGLAALIGLARRNRTKSQNATA
jgi:hypothetical protein